MSARHDSVVNITSLGKGCCLDLKIALLCMVVFLGVLVSMLYFERKVKRKPRMGDVSSGDEFDRSSADQKSASRQTGDGTTTRRPAALEIRDSTDRKILRISLPNSNFFEAQTWQKLEATKTSSWIQPLLTDAIAALPIPLLASMQSSRTFHIVFEGAGHLMRAKDSTGFRSILVDKTGTILSHGKLVPVGHRVLNATAAWELAAIITQRKFLVDIDRKLLALRSGVAEIESFLKNERIGRLQANTRSIAETVLLVRENPSFLYQQLASQHMLEEIEREASGDVRACLLDLQSLNGRLGQVSLAGFWSADMDPLSREIESATGILRVGAFALSVRCFAAGMLPHYAEDQQRLQGRLADIVSVWHELNDSSKSIQRVAMETLDRMHETISRQSTIDFKKQTAKDDIRRRFTESARLLKSVLDDSQLLREERTLLELGETPIHLKVSVNREGILIDSQIAASCQP